MSVNEGLEPYISRNSRVMLQLPSDGAVYAVSSRMLSSEPAGIWLQLPAEKSVLIDELLRNRALVEVCFGNSSGRMTFRSTLTQRQENFSLNGSTIAAICLSWPATISSLQQRSDYRVSVTESCDVRATIWVIADDADLTNTPPLPQQLRGRINNISSGGAALWLEGRSKENARTLVKGQRLRIELEGSQGNIVLAGHTRAGPHKLDQSQLVGVRFESFDSFDGKRKLSALQRLIGELQRAESRRRKMGC